MKANKPESKNVKTSRPVMKFKNFLFPSFLFAFFSAFPQTESIYVDWVKTYGGSKFDIMYSIAPTEDNRFILGGRSNSNDGDIQSGNIGDNDFWVVKIDQEGVVQWENTYGGFYDGVYDGGSEFFKTFKKTSDGGYLLGGDTNSDNGDIKSGLKSAKALYGGITQADMWAVKIDQNGVIQWENTYGGSGNEWLFSILETNDGFLLGGSTTSEDKDIKTGHRGSGDCWVVKINKEGILQWEKTYGGSHNEFIAAIEPTEDGGFLLGGGTNSNDGDVQSENNSSQKDIWIVKINAVGELLWEKTYGGTDYDIMWDMHPASNGSFLLAGETLSNDGDFQSLNHGINDVWVIKIDSEGEIIWSRTYGGSYDDFLMIIEPTTDGNYLLGCGSASSDGNVNTQHKGGWDGWVVKINDLGDIVSQMKIGGSNYDNISSIKPTIDGGFLVGGWTFSSDLDMLAGNKGESDYWVAKVFENHPPTEISLTTTNIQENQPSGSEIGIFSANDIDQWDDHTLVLASGEGDGDNALFKIEGDKLLSGGLLNFEAKSSYSIRVEATDLGNLKFNTSLIINVLDANDAPTDISLSSNSLDERALKGTEVGFLTTTDEDAGDTFTYSLVTGEGDSDNGNFSILEDKLVTNTAFDYDTKSNHFVRIQSRDKGGMILSKSFTINIIKNDYRKSQSITFTLPESVYENEGPIELTASSTSGLAISYSVTEGPATVSRTTLTLAGAGTVKVTAAQAGNDEFKPAASVTAGMLVKALHSISGTVSGAEGETLSGKVQAATAGGTIAGDATLASNEFAIAGLKDGDYFLKYIPSDASLDLYYMTYYAGPLQWNDAEVVGVSAANVSGISWSALPKASEGATGKGVIVGSVVADESAAKGTRIILGRSYEGGSPLEGVVVYLLKSSDNSVVKEAVTNAEGRFEMRNLAGGSYRLHVDVPGIAMDPNTSAIELDESKHLELTAVVGENGITTEVTIQTGAEDENHLAILIYPNPVKDYLKIDLEGQSGNDLKKIVKLFNLLGQEQLTKIFHSNSITLNLQQLASGIYLLTIENEEGMLLKQVKVMKE